MRDSIITNKKGSILVISVILMSIMSIITFALSRVVIRQLDFSRNLDNSVMAYYGADSGIEQGLYEARKLDIVSINESGSLSNGVKWMREINPLRYEITFGRIEKNKSIQLDLFDPDFPTCDNVVPPNVKCIWESMNIIWSGTGTVQLTLVEWPVGETIIWDPSEATEIKLLNASSPWIINDLRAGFNYRIKIKALLGDITDVNVVLYSKDNAQGEVVQIPNLLDITGTGDYQTSKQAVNVNIPRKAPLSSLYDYVLFSEEDIVKEP